MSFRLEQIGNKYVIYEPSAQRQVKARTPSVTVRQTTLSVVVRLPHKEQYSTFCHWLSTRVSRTRTTLFSFTYKRRDINIVNKEISSST